MQRLERFRLAMFHHGGKESRDFAGAFERAGPGNDFRGREFPDDVGRHQAEQLLQIARAERGIGIAGQLDVALSAHEFSSGSGPSISPADPIV